MKSELKAKIIAFIVTAVVVMCGIISNSSGLEKQTNVDINQLIAMESMAVYNIDEDLDSFINDNKEIFDFYTKTFGITIEDLKASIIDDNSNVRLNYNDIGNDGSNYDRLDKNIIDYLFNLKKENPNLFNQEYVSGKEYSKEYIYGLIDYYSYIYENVDAKTLKSIAYIESGNLNSNYMVKNNNIYGGMSSKGLLKYKNIEYGTLVYVKMMSERYYGKGLTTIEKIAKKYNLGSKTWIKNVTSMLNKFEDNDIYDINALISLI